MRQHVPHADVAGAPRQRAWLQVDHLGHAVRVVAVLDMQAQSPLILGHSEHDLKRRAVAVLG